jgi:tetratricopeptide (TPR) repeat protein
MACAAAYFNLGYSLERSGDTARAQSSTSQKRCGSIPGLRQDNSGWPGSSTRKAGSRTRSPPTQDTLRLNPNDAQARLDLGFDLAQLGRFEGAIAQYSAVALKGNGSDELEFKWGLPLLQSHETNEAAQHSATALQVKPDLEPARRALNSLSTGSSH